MSKNYHDGIDRGELTSRQNGNLTRAMVEQAEQSMKAQEAVTVEFAKELVEKDSVPNTIKNQNLGYNSKKTGLGPNLKR
ncbi:MAG: hypothetical protein VB095_00840 [Anaerovorax sp.]|nr:hypothetical protein [Anaerovorax sp.]